MLALLVEAAGGSEADAEVDAGGSSMFESEGMGSWVVEGVAEGSAGGVLLSV